MEYLGGVCMKKDRGLIAFVALAVVMFVGIFLVGVFIVFDDRGTVEVRKGTVIDINNIAKKDSNEASSGVKGSSSGASNGLATKKAHETVKDDKMEVERITDEPNGRTRVQRIPAHMLTYWRKGGRLLFSYDKYREFTEELISLDTYYSAGPCA